MSKVTYTIVLVIIVAAVAHTGQGNFSDVKRDKQPLLEHDNRVQVERLADLVVAAIVTLGLKVDFLFYRAEHSKMKIPVVVYLKNLEQDQVTRLSDELEALMKKESDDITAMDAETVVKHELLLFEILSPLFGDALSELDAHVGQSSNDQSVEQNQRDLLESSPGNSQSPIVHQLAKLVVSTVVLFTKLQYGDDMERIMLGYDVINEFYKWTYFGKQLTNFCGSVRAYLGQSTPDQDDELHLRNLRMRQDRMMFESMFDQTMQKTGPELFSQGIPISKAEVADFLVEVIEKKQDNKNLGQNTHEQDVEQQEIEKGLLDLVEERLMHLKPDELTHLEQELTIQLKKDPQTLTYKDNVTVFHQRLLNPTISSLLNVEGKSGDQDISTQEEKMTLNIKRAQQAEKIVQCLDQAPMLGMNAVKDNPKM